MTSVTSDHGAEILSRIIRPEEGGMPAEAAQTILRFQLADNDRGRVNELAEGVLSANERLELDEYERVTALLELMQSKARLSLKQAGVS